MIKHTKKGVLMANSTSSGATSKIKEKFRDMWLFIKQVWYVPFIWSLAWFSYWICHDTIMLGQPLLQINTTNLFGVVLSIGAILFAGYISRKSREKIPEKTGLIEIEKKNSFKYTKVEIEGQSQNMPVSEYLLHQSSCQESDYPELQSENYLSTEPNQIDVPNMAKVEKIQVPSSSNSVSDQAMNGDQTKTQQDIPSDCLVCPKLANCDQRQNRSTESKTPCPFATHI